MSAAKRILLALAGRLARAFGFRGESGSGDDHADIH